MSCYNCAKSLSGKQVPNLAGHLFLLTAGVLGEIPLSLGSIVSVDQ